MNYRAEHVRWDRNADAARLESPVERLRHQRTLEPSIKRRIVELDSGWVELVLEELGTASIPIPRDGGIVGCDGTSFEFRFGGFYTKLELHWWEDPPKGWERVVEIFFRLLGDLEKKFVDP